MTEEEKEKAPDLSENEENKPSEKDEIEVTLGEEEIVETPETPEWIKRTRQSNRDLKKQNLNLKKQLQDHQAEKAPAELGPKPTIESCDFKTDEFEQKLDEWHVKNQEQKSQRATEDASWNAQLAGYEEQKAALSPRVANFDEAEAVARDYLTPFQQGVLIKAAENPALITYFLGKNPEELERVSKIKDYFKFAAEVSKLEAKLKTTKM